MWCVYEKNYSTQKYFYESFSVLGQSANYFAKVLRSIESRRERRPKLSFLSWNSIFFSAGPDSSFSFSPHPPMPHLYSPGVRVAEIERKKIMKVFHCRKKSVPVDDGELKKEIIFFISLKAFSVIPFHSLSLFTGARSLLFRWPRTIIIIMLRRKLCFKDSLSQDAVDDFSCRV